MFHATMTIVYRLLALPLVAAIVAAAPVFAQEFQIPTVTISGGELAQDTRLAPADADAFRRRVSQPPRLDDPPVVTDTPYTVTSDYWPSAVRLEDDEDERDVEDEGDYYLDGGYVRVAVGDEDAWLVLDLRQRAILDRYIRLSLSSAAPMGGEPSTMDVLALIAGQEPLGVAVAGQALDEGRATELIVGLARTNPEPFIEPRSPPDGDGDGFWLTVTLVEGRTMRYFYDGESLMESLGTERYEVSAVAQQLEGLRPAAMPSIPHEEPVGSRLWWPVMVGGGIVALAAAVWLRRRSNP